MFNKNKSFKLKAQISIEFINFYNIEDLITKALFKLMKKTKKSYRYKHRSNKVNNTQCR